MPLLPLVLLTLSAAEAANLERAQIFSDEELWHRLVSGLDPIAPMSFGQAVVSDPRRIDALMGQKVLVAMQQLMPGGSPELARAAWMDAARAAGGINRPLKAIVDVHELNWEPYFQALHGQARFPPGLQRQAPRIRQAFDSAVAVGREAAATAAAMGEEEDAALWTRLADVYQAMGDAMVAAMEGRPPAPRLAPGAPQLPAPEEDYGAASAPKTVRLLGPLAWEDDEGAHRLSAGATHDRAPGSVKDSRGQAVHLLPGAWRHRGGQWERAPFSPQAGIFGRFHRTTA